MEVWTIDELMEIYYGYKPDVDPFGIEVWQQIKDKFGIKEKHYYHYKKNCIPVCFKGYYGGEKILWCETPKRKRNMANKISNAGGLISWMYK